MKKDDAVLTTPIADPTTSVRIESVQIVFGDAPSARIIVGWYSASGTLARTEAIAVAPPGDGPPPDLTPPPNAPLDEMMQALLTPVGDGKGEPADRWRRRLMTWLVGFRRDLFGDVVVSAHADAAVPHGAKK